MLRNPCAVISPAPYPSRRNAAFSVLLLSGRSAERSPGKRKRLPPVNGCNSRSSGTRVVDYAQSESPEAAQRIINRLREANWLARNRALGEAHPGLYDVVFTLDR